MTPEYIQANQIIERYLAGKLDDATADEFESRLLWDRDLQDEFELVRRFREGIKDIEQPAGAGTPESGHPPRARSRPPLALAASLLIAVGFGVVLSQFTLRNVLNDPFSTAEVFSLETMRSTPGPDGAQRIAPSGDATSLTLLVYPATSGFDTFRAELTKRTADGNWERVWQGKPVSSLRDNTLGVSIRNDILSPGTYRLTVAGWSGQSPPSVASEDYFEVPGP